MAMIRRALPPAVALAIALSIQSCGANHTGKRALPLPTARPCVAATLADLAALASESSMIVEATIGFGPATSKKLSDGNSPLLLDETPLTAVKVLSRGANATAQASAPTVMNGAGFSWSDLLTPGRYLLFLLNTGKPTEGFNGIFNISNGSLAQRCPNFQNPARPLTATGTGLSVAAAEAAIPTTITAPVASPKPSSAAQP
jgi:hypothetical protein